MDSVRVVTLGVAAIAIAGCGRHGFEPEDGRGGAPRSCASLPAACGASGEESCCNDTMISGGTFNRSSDAMYPATVSTFRLDNYEVTVGRFRAFIAAGQGTQASPPAPGAGAHSSIADSGWDPAWNVVLVADAVAFGAVAQCDPALATWTDAPAGNENRPINCINWYEAMAFCIWDGGYLASEAEWNYAATGGSVQRYYPWSNPPGSSVIDSAHASYFDGVDCVGDEAPGCTLSDIVAVGTKPAGDGVWGQSELAGNVAEWGLDWYAPYAVPCIDCANVVPATSRLARGGGMNTNAGNVSAGTRGWYAPNTRLRSVGARCARPL